MLITIPLLVLPLLATALPHLITLDVTQTPPTNAILVSQVTQVQHHIENIASTEAVPVTSAGTVSSVHTVIVAVQGRHLPPLNSSSSIPPVVSSGPMELESRRQLCGPTYQSVGTTRTDSVSSTRTESVGTTRTESVGTTRTESVGTTRTESVSTTRTDSFGTTTTNDGNRGGHRLYKPHSQTAHNLAERELAPATLTTKTSPTSILHPSYRSRIHVQIPDDEDFYKRDPGHGPMSVSGATWPSGMFHVPGRPTSSLPRSDRQGVNDAPVTQTTWPSSIMHPTPVPGKPVLGMPEDGELSIGY